MSTVSELGKFIKTGLKERIRERELLEEGTPDTEGYGYTFIDWPALNKAIDKLCREFKKEKRK